MAYILTLSAQRQAWNPDAGSAGAYVADHAKGIDPEAFFHTDTALEAVKACTRAALSTAAQRRDAYLDRLEEFSEDERAEHEFALRELV